MKAVVLDVIFINYEVNLISLKHVPNKFYIGLTLILLMWRIW